MARFLKCMATDFIIMKTVLDPKSNSSSLVKKTLNCSQNCA